MYGTEHEVLAKPCTMLRSLMGSSSLRLVSPVNVIPCRQIHSYAIQTVRMRPQITPGYRLLHPGRRRVVEAATMAGISSFHSTPRRQSIPLLLSALKVGAPFFRLPIIRHLT